MAGLTREAIHSILGQVDDHLAAELIATDATPTELLEARAWISNDEMMINAGRRLGNGRVGTLVNILMRAEEADAPAATATDET